MPRSVRRRSNKRVRVKRVNKNRSRRLGRRTSSKRVNRSRSRGRRRRRTMRGGSITFPESPNCFTQGDWPCNIDGTIKCIRPQILASFPVKQECAHNEEQLINLEEKLRNLKVSKAKGVQLELDEEQQEEEI